VRRVSTIDEEERRREGREDGSSEGEKYGQAGRPFLL
jgi:hypothetical protein